MRRVGSWHITRLLGKVNAWNLLNIWYIFFWVFPRRLNIKSRRFGTLCRFHLHRWVGVNVEQLDARGCLVHVCGRVILKCFLNKWLTKLWTGFIWLSLRTNGGLVRRRYYSFRLPRREFHCNLNDCWFLEQVSALWNCLHVTVVFTK
jgi:hypothetical protein